MKETPSADPSAHNENSAPPKPRRKRQAVLESTSEGPGEEWMLTYMDTVTLLVTLFVMILSFASFETEKFKEFSHGMSLAKYGSGIMMGTPSIMDRRVIKNQITSELPATKPGPAKTSSPTSEPVPDDKIAALQEQITQQGLGDEVALRARGSTVEMEINESVLFPAGRADLSPLGLSVLLRLSNLLKTHQGSISVEGHTDNLPINTDQFPSNWELSGSRASSVVRHLISSGVAPDQLRIVGYADNRPLGTNASVDGRQRNRRVNIVLQFGAPSE